MATVQSTGIVLVNGYDLSAYFKTINTEAEQAILDSTNLATSGARTFNVGLNEHRVSGEGFFDYNSSTPADGLNKQLSDALGSTAALVMVGTDGATLGYPAWMANVREKSFSIKEIVGDLIMVNFEATATNDTTNKAFATGVWLMNATQTGAANGTGYDNSATSTGYFAQCHVTGSDGTATVKVQHSTNNSTWADLVTFGGAIASKTAAQASSTSTSVNRYVRAIVTAIGGTTAKVSVAIKLGYTG